MSPNLMPPDEGGLDGKEMLALPSSPDSGQDRRVMFRPQWKHARLAASVAASLVLTIVVAPVLGELAIAWLRKRHFYDDPDKTVAAIIAALHALISSWWFQWGGGTIVGFSVGAWLDSIFGRTSKKRGAYKATEAAVDTRGAEARPASIAAWDKIDPLSLREAACLWAGFDPSSITLKQELSGESAARKRLIQQGVRDGYLLPERGPNISDVVEKDRPAMLRAGEMSVADYEKFYRRDLRRFCAAIGERPSFLFDAPAPTISLAIDVEPLRGLLHGSGERYYVVITNESDKTIENIFLRALESWFTQVVIAKAVLGRSDDYRRPLDIKLKIDDLHPNAPERVQIMGIAYADMGSSLDILNTVQRFTFEVRGKDTKAVRETFEYDPKARPMIRAVE